MDSLEEIAPSGRVTRSLRKRLTSIDSSDAGSRPNTPIPSKLTAISETNSPARSTRQTRRNSMTGASTPVKTPAKSRSATIAESSDSSTTSMKRSTRKRTSSTTEETTDKTGQMTIGQPKFDNLYKEQDDEQDKVDEDVPTKRVTRLQSKSPPQPPKINSLQAKSPNVDKKVNSGAQTNGNSTTKVKVGPQSKSRRSRLINESDTDESDAEVIILEDDDEVETTDKISSPEKPTNKAKSPEFRLSLRSSDRRSESAAPNDEKKIDTIVLLKESEANQESLTKTNNENELEDTQEINKSLENPSNEQIENTLHEEQSDQTKETVELPKKFEACVKSVVRLEKLSPDVICRLTGKENINTSCPTNDRPRNSKTVAFDETNDEIEKNVYPKTPALTKSKSYIDVDSSNENVDNSYQSEKESTNHSKDASDHVKSGDTKLNDSKESEEYHDATNDLEEKNEFELPQEKTPLKSNLMSNIQSSTPVIESISQLKSENVVSKMINLVEETIENVKVETPKKISEVNDNIPVSQFKDSLNLESATGEADMESVEEKIEKNQSDAKPNEQIASNLEGSDILNNSALAVTEEVTTKNDDNSDPYDAKPSELIESTLDDTQTLNNNSLVVTEEVSEETDQEPHSPEVISNEVIVSEVESTEILHKPLTTTEEAIEKTDEKSILEDSQILKKSNFAVAEEDGEKNEVESNTPLPQTWLQNVSVAASSEGKIDTISPFSTPEERNTAEGTADSSTNDPQSTESAKKKPEVNINTEMSADEDDSLGGKCEFVDDEALEANEDYESGDSLDSEERREMEDNEIRENGESLGSEDTEGSVEEEDVEENASFVTSDSEGMLLEYSDDEEHLDDSTENKQIGLKKRAFNIASSESESENEYAAANESSSNQPLTLDVTKMIDETINDDAQLELTEQKCTPESTNKIEESDGENVLTEDNKKLNKSVSLPLANENDANEEEVPSKRASLSFSKDNLSNVGNGDKASRKNLLKMKTRAIESSDSDSDDEECNGLSSSQSLRVQRAKLYESSNEDNDSGNEIAPSQNVKQMFSKSSAQITATSDDIIADPQKNKDAYKLVDENENEDATKTNTTAHDDEDVSISQSKIQNNENTANSSNLNDTINSNADNDNDNDVSKEDVVIPETQQADSESSADHAEALISASVEKGNTDVSFDASDEEAGEEADETDIHHEVISKAAGLSKSFSQYAVNKDADFSKKVMRNSFTIGVTVSNNVRHVVELKPNSDEDNDHNDESDDENCVEGDVQANISVSSNRMLLSSDEEQELEKLSKEELRVNAFNLLDNKRQSLDVHSISNPHTHTSATKALKRKSLHVPNATFNPSQSLIENIEERKRDLYEQSTSKQRLSKSFNNVTEDLEPTNGEKRDDTNGELGANAPKTNRQEKQDRLQSILERCDEILDAANCAKLEAKLNYKKSKIIMPRDRKRIKLKNKNEEDEKDEGDTFIRKYTKKEMKQAKDKTKSALKQAIRASAKILMNATDKKKNTTTLLQVNESEWEEKRFPAQLLEAVSNCEEKVDKKSKDGCHFKQTKDSSHASIQHIKSTSGDIVEEVLTPPKKKKTIFNKFELPTGIVIEEPITPKREKIVSGFRVSPVTPRTIGFKVRRILSAGQDTPPTLSTLSREQRKRKHRIEEPTHTLPKPQWTQSGTFIEEPLTNTRTISKTDATEFLVAGLNRNGKRKCRNLAASATANALNFKNSIMNRGNHQRETTRAALMRKERQFIQKQF